MGEEESNHHGFVIFLKFETLFLFLLVTAGLIYLSGPVEDDPILFKGTIEDVYNKYPVDVMPPDWLQATWLLVGLCIFTFMIYDMTLLCRRPNDKKGFLYFRPPFIPLNVYIGLTLSLLALIGWVVLWLVEFLKWSALALGAAGFLGFYATYMAAQGLANFHEQLDKEGKHADVLVDRILVQNSLALYSGWMLIVGLLNLAVALVYEWETTDELATTIILACLGGLMLTYFIVDILVFSKAMRFILSPYILFTTVLAIIFAIKFEDEFGERNSLINLFMLGLVGFLTIFKVASMLSHMTKTLHHHHHHDDDHEKLLHDGSGSDDSDSDEVSDEETAQYIKQAQILLSAKKGDKHHDH